MTFFHKRKEQKAAQEAEREIAIATAREEMKRVVDDARREKHKRLSDACDSGMRGHSWVLGESCVHFNNGHNEVINEREKMLINAAYTQGRLHERSRKTQ